MSIKARIWHLLDANPKMSARTLAVEAECSYRTAARYRNKWHQGEPLTERQDPEVAHIEFYPVQTRAGLVYAKPIEAPSRAPPGYDVCDVCAKRAICRMAVHQKDAIGCEWMLKSELQ